MSQRCDVNLHEIIDLYIRFRISISNHANEPSIRFIDNDNLEHIQKPQDEGRKIPAQSFYWILKLLWAQS